MGTPLNWIAFNLFIVIAIALDLRVFHRRPHKIAIREAAIASFGWIAASVLFGFGVLYFRGPQPALEFFTGYLIEKALSVDNLFLFLVIFRAFAVDERLQHRLLEWGVAGALVMRGVMIALGVELIEHFSWVMYVLGAFLVYAGVRMLFFNKGDFQPEQSRLFRFASRRLRVSHEYHGEHFFVRIAGRLVLAILGLRALYFLLAGVIDRLRFLDEGLAIVLVFIGAKMIGEGWLHIPVTVSLGVVGGVLLIALLASLLIPRKKKT